MDYAQQTRLAAAEARAAATEAAALVPGQTRDPARFRAAVAMAEAAALWAEAHANEADRLALAGDGDEAEAEWDEASDHRETAENCLHVARELVGPAD